MTDIVIIGAGNVAHHYSAALYSAGYKIKHVYNRTHKKAVDLAKKVNGAAIQNLNKINKYGLVLICVSDDAIPDIILSLSETHSAKTKIAHTSGILGVDISGGYFENMACVWPVQSLLKDNHSVFNEIPLCLDASNEKFLVEINNIFSKLSRNVFRLPSEKKKHVHLAAVVANNFANHVIHLAEEICQEQDIDRNVLYPLLSGMNLQLKEHTAHDLQTGPARRHDMKTIQIHLDLIEDKKLKDLYRHLTESIIYTYHENH